jgi:P-type Ca2+ transporter type 2C
VQIKTTEDVIKDQDVDPLHGLSEDEATVRLALYGLNQLHGKRRKSIFRLFIQQLQDWLIYILLIAVVITLFLGEYTDAIIIILVIIINSFLGVFQKIKAEKAIEALQKMTSAKTLVRRDGKVDEIDSENVVPGDILILDAGRIIAADIRLIESVNLRIDESALTGESVPSDKDALQAGSDPEALLGDRSNMAFMSTLITGGRGVGIVVETGMNTEVGKIATLINLEEKTKTPLEIRLGKLGKTLGLFALGVCVLIFIISMLQGRDLAEMFLVSVSLAVAAIPEGLVAIVAVVLSIGVTRMSKKNTIIKSLPAIETLGCVNIICSDKTGTLTQNKMTVVSYFNLEGKKMVRQDKQGTEPEDVKLLVKALVLSSDATFVDGHGTGDPTEIALLVLADALGVDRKALNAGNKRIREVPFDSDRKLMSTLIEEKGRFTVYTKGALGSLLEISTHVLDHGKVVPITEAHQKQYLTAAEGMANDALRTLGVAYKPVDSVYETAEMEKELILAGIVAMNDPPRNGVKASIMDAKTAGITTIMITGDHKSTAFAIGKELGIAERIDQAMTGHEVDDFSEKEFAVTIEGYRIFARVSPEHKVKIVRALKSNGSIVSMTGDGVNDAPSLHAADIGVAMGIAGTDVAKEASDMILADDNFSTIVSAIGQGRNIYNNIKKSVIFLLTCNLGEVLAVFVTLLVGWEAPLIATQLLLINLLTDSFPAVALGMEPGNPDVMKEKPRNPKESFFAGGAGLHIILGGFLIGGLTIFAFWFGYYDHGYSPMDHSVPADTVEYARTMAFMVLTICQLLYSLAIRNRTKSIFSIGLFSNKYLSGAILLGVLLQLIVIGVPVIQHAFHLQMLDSRSWLMVIALGLVPLLFNEVFKIFARAHQNLRNRPE